MVAPIGLLRNSPVPGLCPSDYEVRGAAREERGTGLLRVAQSPLADSRA